MDVRGCSLLPKNYRETLGQFKKTSGRFSTVTNLKDIKVEVLEKRVVIENSQYRYVIPLEKTKAMGNPQNLMAGSLIFIKNGKEDGATPGSERHKKWVLEARALLIKQIKTLPESSKDSDRLKQLLQKIDGLLKFAEQKFFCDSLTEN